MGEVMKWPVYAALLPIIGGVGLASASELSFNWLCFGAAMGSNFGSAARAVYSKKVMSGGNIGKNMDSANVYAVLTIMASISLMPKVEQNFCSSWFTASSSITCTMRSHSW